VQKSSCLHKLRQGISVVGISDQVYFCIESKK